MVDRRRLDLSGITPPLQPVRPGDLGSEEDARRRRKEIEKYLKEAERGPLWVALQWTALIVGLAVVVAIVSRLAVIVSRLVYRRFQR